MFLKKKAFRVKLKGRSGIEYSEGPRGLFLGAEFMAGGNDLVIYSDTLKSWNSPHEMEMLSESDKKRIQNNITNDLLEHNISVEWV